MFEVGAVCINAHLQVVDVVASENALLQIATPHVQEALIRQCAKYICRRDKWNVILGKLSHSTA